MAGCVDLFVYGTLKQGFANHRMFCKPALKIRAATIAGQLYDLPVGYPAAQIRDDGILLQASRDPAHDAARQRRFRARTLSLPEAGQGVVHGEWIRLPDPARTLPRVDALEGVRADGRGEYRRALVPARTDEGPRALWVYWMSRLPSGARYLPGGAWPPRS